MGCANSHSEDIHKTSLLESDKFVTSLQDVPGYFNRTIQTSDFLTPKFPDASPEKPEMSYTGPPSHLRNSVDFHPYWHLLQQEYIPSEPIKESDGEIPPSLLPSTETAQQMRDIVVHEAITDLRLKVKETLAEKLKENEDEYLREDYHNSEDGEMVNNDIESHQTALGKGEPPPLPEADYTDGDDDLAQAEKDTIDFLDSVINESMVWDEETGEELVMERREDGNWSFAPSDTQGEEVINYHVPDSNKPFPGVNLDIASNSSTPPNSSPAAFSKSIYLPEDKSSFISNNVIARQTTSSHISSTLDKRKQVTKPKMRKNSERTEKQLPKSPDSSGPASLLSSPVNVPPPPAFRPPPPPSSETSQTLPKEELHAEKTSTNKIRDIPNGRVSSDSSPKAALPPSPPTPPPAPTPSPAPATLPSMERRRSSQLEENKELNSPAKVVSPSKNVPSSPPPPTAPRPPPPSKKETVVQNNATFSSNTGGQPSFSKNESTVNSEGTKTAPPPAPKPKAKPSKPPAVKTKPVRHSMVELPREKDKTNFVRHSMVELPRDNDKTNSVRHSMVELPRDNDKTNSVRHSMVELPKANDIADELPSDDSGIREESSEKSIQDIIKNLKLENPSQTTATLERKSKAKVPPPTAKKPKAPRPVSMPPPSTPPLVKPKPQRKVHGQSNGTLPHGNVSRTSSFASVNRGSSSKRHLSDDASSEDSGLHMKEVEDTDILSQIRLEVT